jgi:hypothetical protein
MAIVINGSGTVTGLAVGGLPDGTVDNGTMADDAINTSELAANAVSGAKIDDNAVGVAKLSATGTASSSTFLRGDNAWAAAGGGKVLQVVSNSVQPGGGSTSSTSFVASTCTATITPSATSSKIFAIAQAHGSNEGAGRYLYWTIYRDSTNLAVAGSQGMGQMFTDSSGGTRVRASISATFLDSPSTTSATVYTLYYRSNSSSNTVELPPSGATMTMTLFEIGA